VNFLNYFGIVTAEQKKQSETLEKQRKVAAQLYRGMIGTGTPPKELEAARQAWLQAKKEAVSYSGHLRNIEISRRKRIAYLTALAVVVAFGGCAWGAYKEYKKAQKQQSVAAQMYLLKSSALERTK